MGAPAFNLMFKTPWARWIGTNFVYAPKTARPFHGAAMGFHARRHLRVAQIGKAFRNVSAPELHLPGAEFDVELNSSSPQAPMKIGTAWVEARIAWWEAQGVPRDRLELLVVEADELAHYSKATTDIMYRFPHGLEELEGVANRTDFDLGSHSKDQEGLALSASVEPNTDSNARLAIQTQTARPGKCYVIGSPRG